jgi:hypothetical protein
VAALGSSRSAFRSTPDVIWSFSIRAAPASVLIFFGFADPSPSSSRFPYAGRGSVAAVAMMVSNVGIGVVSSKKKLCSSSVCILAIIFAFIAATSLFGLFPPLASSCANMFAAVRMCVANAERSGLSLLGRNDFLGTGLSDRVGSEDRGVPPREDMVERLFAPLEDLGQAADEEGSLLLSRGALNSSSLIMGEVPMSPAEGSKTLLGPSSSGSTALEVRGASARSNMRWRLPEASSCNRFASNIPFSNLSGSKLKSSRKISTIRRYGTRSALFSTVASAGLMRTMRW